MSSIRCTGVRVEHLVEPLGLDTARPRFSWVPEEARQNAYEIEVEDRAGSCVWATGRMDSPESVLIQYDGEVLRSNTAYIWRVRAWAEDSPAPGDWTSSRFETGLLHDGDWLAQWVTPPQESGQVERWSLNDWIMGRKPEAAPEDRLRPVQLLRQEFIVGEGLARARAYVTARGSYSLRLNGAEADDQVLAPGFDSYTHRLSAQCYDVTDLLSVGGNALGLALADGWWAGRIGLTGSSAQWGDLTSAIWQVHLEYDDGSSAVVLSGPEVRCSAGPWRYADLFVGEYFDRRAEPADWDRPAFDDRQWWPAAVGDEASARIVPFSGEPVRRVATVDPVLVTGSPDEGFVVDFGQVIAGRVRLTLPYTERGQTVTIEHTETLDAHGEWFINIDGINKEQTDVYIAAGLPGGETFEPTFTFHGFRYARLRGLAVQPTRDELAAIVIASDLEAAGGFHSSDERLNRLHENVLWSQRANFLSVPTDCPQRERAGWTGDIAAYAPAAANNARVAPFLTRWLRNLRADQLPDGQVPIYSPRSPFDAEEAETGSGLGAIVSSAGWGDAIAIVPWTLYERYEDLRVLEENYDAMCRWIEYQRQAATELPASLTGDSLSHERRGRQALLYNAGAHFGDWLTPSTLAGRPLHEAIGIAPALTAELVAPMFQAQTLTLAERTARVLRKDDDAVDFSRRAAAVRKAFCEEYIDGDGRLPVHLQGLYVLAIAFAMVPEPLRDRMAEHLAALVTENGGRLDTGFLSTPHLLDALWDTGHRDLARNLLWQSELPSWLYQVDRGATSIWEAWDAIAPDGSVRAVSFNHYAFGCVDDWFFRRLAGIRQTSPGYRSVVVEPDFECGLDHVSAHLDTPYGTIAVEWDLHDGGAELSVSIPFQIEARLITSDGEVPLPPGTSRHRIHVPATSLV
ncbi:family 78 glycoside hydrolase catalytic domain [Arthrobacter sp. NA-172]|uniref:family 78 glycoside hydrolase catalytic domain n=1 Tax=Arthrobacter sp. NA-172 TaxID=3367524 RepID=UPI0037549355